MLSLTPTISILNKSGTEVEDPKEICREWCLVREKFEKDGRVIPLLIDTGQSMEGIKLAHDFTEKVRNLDNGFRESLEFVQTVTSMLSAVVEEQGLDLADPRTEQLLEKIILGGTQKGLDLGRLGHEVWGAVGFMSDIVLAQGITPEDIKSDEYSAARPVRDRLFQRRAELFPHLTS